MKKRASSLYGGIAAAALAVMAGIGGGPVPVKAESPAISVGNWTGNTVEAPVLQPSWTADVDQPGDTDAGQAALAEDGQVFAFREKQLLAIDAASGKRLWKYGSGLAPVLAYDQGTVYGLTGGRNVFALNGSSGTRKWISSVKLPTGSAFLQPLGDTVYAIQQADTYAFDRKTGKLKWKSSEPMSEGTGSKITEADGVLFQTYLVQGALSSVQLDAFDKQTGKKLWSVFRQNGPLTVKDGLVYSITDPYPFDDASPQRSVKVAAFNVKTGVKKGERVYSWTISGEPPYSTGAGTTAFLSGNGFYVFQDGIIAQYDFANYVPNGKPVKKWYNPYANAEPLSTIYQGRMFFRDYNTGELKGMKLVNGQPVGWRGDNPAEQIDIYGSGVYVAQTDGVFHGFNLQTTKPVFTVKTGARNYGTTLKTGSTIIIQAGGRLIGVKIPKELQG